MIVPGPENGYFRAVRFLALGWVAVLVLGLYPYTEDPAAPIKYTASAVIAMAMAAVWAAGVASGRAPFRPLHLPFIVLLAFLAAQGVSALLSGTPHRGFASLQPWFVFALVAFLCYQVFTTTRHLRALFRAIVLSVAVSSVYGLMQYAGLDPFPWAARDLEEYRGLPSSYGHPNLAGHALVIALVLAAGLLADAAGRGKGRRAPAIYAVSGCLMLAHLYLSGMRGGVVALAFALLFSAVYLLLARRGVSPVRAGTAAIGAVALLLACSAIPAIILAPRLALDSSLQLRLNGYAGAAEMMVDGGVTGMGPGHYGVENIRYWSDFEALWYALEGRRNHHVHNAWLEVAVEGGPGGVSVLILLFLVAIITPLANPAFAAAGHRALSIAAPAALVAVAVDACTGFNLHAPASGGFFFLLVAVQPHIGPASALRGYTRLLPPVLVVVAGMYVAAAWYQFEAARLYWRAQGALAWGREAGTRGPDAADYADVARASLAEARRHNPWDPAIPALAGHLAIAEGRYEEALSHYGRAAALNPHLPRLQVERARALLRLAQEPPSGTRETLLTLAESHARDAEERAPALADAAAMLGWVAFMRGGASPDAEKLRYLSEAVEHFERARRLGLAGDINLDAALGGAYAGLASWPAAAVAFERCAMAAPGDASHWAQFARAATAAGGDWPARYRQALLYHVGRAGPAATPPATAVSLAARLAGCTTVAGAELVIGDTLRGVLAHYPDELGLWSAWLGHVRADERAAGLLAEVGGQEESPAAIRALAAAMETPDAGPLEQAGREILAALATAPGGERRGLDAAVYLPLLDVLERLLDEAGLAPAVLATTRGDTGAAYFEAGEPARADALLASAARALPAADSARILYYRSRALTALGQPDAALALARQSSRASGAPEFSWQLARCLTAVGEVEAAAFLYESLLASLPPGHAYRGPIGGHLESLRGRDTAGPP